MIGPVRKALVDLLCEVAAPKMIIYLGNKTMAHLIKEIQPGDGENWWSPLMSGREGRKFMGFPVCVVNEPREHMAVYACA